MVDSQRLVLSRQHPSLLSLVEQALLAGDTLFVD
jgi:hypothetical protein